MQKEQLVILLQGHFNATLSPQERETLAAFINEPGNKALVIEALAQTGMALPAAEYNSHRFDPLLQNILAADRQAPVRKIINWKRIAVAASLLITIGILYFVISTKEKSPAIVVSPDQQHDVPAPDKNRAQIKLSDGTIVYLDSAANGELVNSNGVTVTKTEDGKIVYSGESGVVSGELKYNTLSNPRGSKVIDMTLADGSRVWLNAGSSVTYPVAFVSNERKVTITGEAYFEVAPNKSKPFIVSANNKADVTVLGTHFNVNAYEDESDIKVTLMEGSVKVSNDVDAKTIKPNQQATVRPHSPLTIHHSPDLEQILAWKNGLFEFNNTELPTIMRQLARWYDLDIIYQSQPSHEKYGGGISNAMPLSNVLKLLEANGVKFELQGKKLIVKP